MTLHPITDTWFKGTYKGLTFYGWTRQQVVARFAAYMAQHPELVKPRAA